jgi:hypothetical protein
MLDQWHDFYLLIGGAAGALIGLLFVVVSLTGGLETKSIERGQKLYMTPNLVHFGVVLGVGALAMAPGVPRSIGGGVVTILALSGLFYTALVGIGLKRGEASEPPHWSDFWFYSFVPAVLYAALAVSGVMFIEGAPWALHAGAAALCVLMFVAIRNAWDLITFIAPRTKT